MGRAFSCGFALAVALGASRARAGDFPDDQTKVLPCRPTVACTADIVPPGTLEIEAGWLSRRVRNAGFVHAQPILVKLSMSEIFQLQVGTNGRIFSTGDVKDPTTYLDGLSVGVKAHFRDQTAWLPALALSLAFHVPSWDRPPGAPFAPDATLWGYATKDIGLLHFDFNAAVSALTIGQRAEWQPVIALATSIALPANFGAMIEEYVYGAAGALAAKDGGLLAALSYSPRAWIMFDAGVDASFFPETRAYSLFVGLTAIPWGFGSKKSQDPLPVGGNAPRFRLARE